MKQVFDKVQFTRRDFAKFFEKLWLFFLLMPRQLSAVDCQTYYIDCAMCGGFNGVFCESSWGYFHSADDGTLGGYCIIDNTCGAWCFDYEMEISCPCCYHIRATTYSLCYGIYYMRQGEFCCRNDGCCYPDGC